MQYDDSRPKHLFKTNSQLGRETDFRREDNDGITFFDLLFCQLYVHTGFSRTGIAME